MSALVPSLERGRYLPGERTLCSWEAGWRSLLLRGYREPREVSAFTIPGTADQTLVLVSEGATTIEVHGGGRWQRAQYRVGTVAMTRPGSPTTLRWSGETTHSTLQLNLPTTTLHAAIAELSDLDPSMITMPDLMCDDDPLLAGVISGLAFAVLAGAPELYAETAGELLAVHLLVRHAGMGEPRPPTRHDPRLKRADALLHARIERPVSLRELAEAAGVSRHHFLRLFRQAYGETPLRYLTRLRMERACALLSGRRLSVTEVALRCGYENASHFATAFRRVIGTTPRLYRRPKA